MFEPVWDLTHGDDGWVSFELDPLLEDPANTMPQGERTARYIALAKEWSVGHKNRMIKVPATPAGIAALEEIVAHGVTVNVTLIFSERQYIAARDACWRGAQRRMNRDTFKSVYSIFVSRLDVYTEKHVPELSPAAQGHGRHRQCQAYLEVESTFLGRQGAETQAGNDLRQHGREETRRPAVEVCRGVCRLGHRDQSAEDQCRRREERPNVHAPYR